MSFENTAYFDKNAAFEIPDVRGLTTYKNNKNNKKKIAAGVGAVGLGTAGYLNRNRISNAVGGNKNNQQA